jgi:hypothetical protein
MSGALAALGTGLMSIEGMPEYVNFFAEYAVKIGAVAPLLVAFVASLTVETKDEI